MKAVCLPELDLSSPYYLSNLHYSTSWRRHGSKAWLASRKFAAPESCTYASHVARQRYSQMDNCIFGQLQQGTNWQHTDTFHHFVPLVTQLVRVRVLTSGQILRSRSTADGNPWPSNWRGDQSLDQSRNYFPLPCIDEVAILCLEPSISRPSGHSFVVWTVLTLADLLSSFDFVLRGEV